jgi:hypothetical protein
MCVVLSVFPVLVDKLTDALSTDSTRFCQSGTPATPEFLKSEDGARSTSFGRASIPSIPPTPCSVKVAPQLEGYMAEVFCACFC